MFPTPAIPVYLAVNIATITAEMLNFIAQQAWKCSVSQRSAHFYTDFPKIKTVLKTELDKTLTVLKSEGYSWDEIQEYKEILLLNSKDLRDRLGVLHDFLIQTPTLHQVVYVSEIMHLHSRTTVTQLLCLQVLDNKTLLDLDPVKVTELLDKHPYIGTSSVKDIIVNFPSFLSIPITNIDIWNNMLKKYGVTAFKFNKEALVFFKSHAFKDVEERLNVLVRLPEWQIISMSEKLFYAIRGRAFVKHALNAAESGKLPSVSSLTLGVERKTSVRQTLISQELSAYVAQELNIQQEEARELLHKDLKTKFGVNNIKRVLNLLFDFGFTREQVINGTIVLNFEHSIVEQGLREFPSRPETQPFDEWMENPLVLHLLAYCIKKDVPHLDVSIKR
nr:uncharacterized protein LOC128694556 [Cherax quadricarinatus]